MWLPARRLLTVATLLISGGAAMAQTGSGSSNPLSGRENNPYSKYGIGELSNTNNAILRGMGGASAAIADPFSINAENPSSYASLLRTTFEMGATASSRTITSSGQDYKTGTITLSYLTLAVPFNRNNLKRRNHGGIALGFRPYSRIYYSFQDTIKRAIDPSSSIYGKNIYRQYLGDGSLNHAFIGGAYQVKRLSLGFNFGYLFGNISRIAAVIPDSARYTGAYTTQYNNFTRVGGIYWKGGAQYDVKLDSMGRKWLRIGATFNLGQNVNERLNEFQISSFSFGDTIVNDTTVNRPAQRGTLTLPMSYSIGVSFLSTTKLVVSAQYSATNWSQFRSTVDKAMLSGVRKDNAYRISAGVAYTPDANSVRKYTSRMTYRLGAYYGSDYLNIGGNTIPYFGGTAGVSLPFKSHKDWPHSALDMAFDIGRLGLEGTGLTQQTYMRFTLGLNINARWGIRPKYE